MRILIVSSFFPPNAMGGAEVSAWNFGRWLHRHGHDVAALTTARVPQDQTDGSEEDGLRVWRVAMPRPYPVHAYGSPPNWQRLVWHMQDHLDPRNHTIVARVLDAFDPDAASIHLLTGIGWNTLGDFAQRDLPVLFALPDAALACLRSGMFRDGQNCAAQCRECRISAQWKQHQVRKLRRVGFYSPSLANLARMERLVGFDSHPHKVLANPNVYPGTRVQYSPSTHLRLLYAGRLHPMKGVAVLLEAAEQAARNAAFTLDVLGHGPEEATLKSRFGHHPWLRFHGHVDQQCVSDYMANSDVLCVPSVWEENAPGVVIHALALGLPTLASAIGGLPELIRHGHNGLLAPPGDVSGWARALSELLAAPEHLTAMRANARASAYEFDPDTAGQALFDFLKEIARG